MNTSNCTSLEKCLTIILHGFNTCQHISISKISKIPVCINTCLVLKPLDLSYEGGEDIRRIGRILISRYIFVFDI